MFIFVFLFILLVVIKVLLLFLSSIVYFVQGSKKRLLISIVSFMGRGGDYMSHLMALPIHK
jgi:hypothetical protein